MKNRLAFILLMILAGCAGSPSKIAYEAEQNRIDMIDLRVNMSKHEVQYRMDIPTKIEKKNLNGIDYEVWYYVTRGVILSQSSYVDDNFTPFVFTNNSLKGWGWRFYNHIFDTNNDRFKKEKESKRKYYDNEEIWPNYDHKIITPYKKKKDNHNPLEESLNELIKPEKNTPSSDSQYLEGEKNLQTIENENTDSESLENSLNEIIKEDQNAIPEKKPIAPNIENEKSLEVIEQQIKEGESPAKEAPKILEKKELPEKSSILNTSPTKDKPPIQPQKANKNEHAKVPPTLKEKQENNRNIEIKNNGESKAKSNEKKIKG